MPAMSLVVAVAAAAAAGSAARATAAPVVFPAFCSHRWPDGRATARDPAFPVPAIQGAAVHEKQAAQPHVVLARHTPRRSSGLRPQIGPRTYTALHNDVETVRLTTQE